MRIMHKLDLYCLSIHETRKLFPNARMALEVRIYAIFFVNKKASPVDTVVFSSASPSLFPTQSELMHTKLLTNLSVT